MILLVEFGVGIRFGLIYLRLEGVLFVLLAAILLLEAGWNSICWCWEEPSSIYAGMFPKLLFMLTAPRLSLEGCPVPLLKTEALVLYAKIY
jgi:hypothetical protein